MSSLQRGVCPLCRVSVQVKNFKRHWETHHERFEKKKSYDEVFTSLKANILNQSKSPTTTIDTLFGTKKRRLSSGETAQQQSMITMVQESFFNTESDNNNSRDENIHVLQQVLDDMLDQLENETNVMPSFTGSVEDDDTASYNEPITDTNDVDMIEIENINDQESSCTLTKMKLPTITTPVNPPQCTKVFLPGVEFISDFELKFVDHQRYRLQDDVWLPSGGDGESAPSRSWFTETRSTWLRAVHSDNKYGLMCVVCAKAARDDSRIIKNQGSFISHPFWKLSHHGLEGIKRHEESELHKQSCTINESKLQSEEHGTVLGMLNATKINKKEACFDYLRALARSFIFLLQQEFAFMNVKDLIKLQQLNLAEPVVRWLSVASKKEYYWSGESRNDWLISVQKWLWKKQLEELRDVTYITIMADEICDVTVVEQLCTCLRYFNPSTGELVERIVRLCQINSQTGEAIFDVINQFLFELQNELGKKLILIGQCFDGASSLRFQGQGHIRSRINAFAMYIHCRSHLINLAVMDTLTSEFSKSHELIQRVLAFLRESAQRVNILKNSQIVYKTSKEGSKIPTPSETRWVYHYQLAHFAWTHAVSIVSALIQISENNTDGSDTAAGYATRFANQKIIFEVGIMTIILEHAKNFMKQTEYRSTTFDQFSKSLDSTVARIKNTFNEFDHDIYKQKIQAYRDVLPQQQQTAHSTRSHCTSNNNNEVENHIKMETLKNYAEKIVNSTLRSIDQRFSNDSRIIIDNISMFTKLNDCNDDEVLENRLLNMYCTPMYYKHVGTDQKIYERTDEPLLSFRKLKNELPQVRIIIESANNDVKQNDNNEKMGDELCLLGIVKYISINARYLIPEWFKFYQILTTLPIGSNECERSFSALKRIKTRLRNSLSETSLETAVKFTILKPNTTDNDLDMIVKNFYLHPGRAKTRNIKIYVYDNEDNSDDEID